MPPGVTRGKGAESESVRSQGVMFLENAGCKESITTYSIVCAMVKRLYTTHILGMVINAFSEGFLYPLIMFGSP